MKQWKKYRNCFLALLLIVTMVSSGVLVTGAFAEETQDEQATTTEQQKEEEPTTKQETETTKTTEITKTEAVQEQSSENEDTQLFTLECTADGSKLTNGKDGQNTISNWKADQSKTVDVIVKREETLDTSKKYYICIKTKNLFYFNGLPKKDEITGVNEVTIIKNETPKVNNSTGDTVNLTGFSQYSGEIRLEINPKVERVEVKDVGISCDQRLLGYSKGTQTIEDVFDISVVAVDASEDIKSFTNQEKEELISCNMDKATITTNTTGGVFRNSMSITGYTTDGIVEQNVRLGKTGTIAYAGGLAGQNYQVYKELEIEFQCPYITIDGERHYLSFSMSDTALSQNKQGKKQGFKLAEAATYDPDNHTITYKFKNIYVGDYTSIFYTPNFSWPEDLEDQAVSQDEEYRIEGTGWKITKQTCYTGAQASLSSAITVRNWAFYIADKVDVAMTSSNEAAPSDSIAKRYIYQGLTKEKGNEGTLGFFDVHNKGSLDSPDLDIKFEFNTKSKDEDKAKYYVTRVNLPVYDNQSGVDLKYTLTNASDASDEITGTKHYTNKSSFVCYVKDLRADSGVDSKYYIKEISYQTKLEKGKSYHAETAHLYRNRDTDSGLFFGYIEGELNQTASAKMTISSVDGTAITSNGETKITSTETSTVSDEDYIDYSVSDMKIDNGASQSITAGNSTNLEFGAYISTEEYQMGTSHTVNGYHVFRDGIMYVCLPKGVSISGTEQVEVSHGTVKNVTELPDTECTVDGVEARWYQIDVDNMNVSGGSTFKIKIQLATKNTMQGVVWYFQNSVIIRAKGQKISWNSAIRKGTSYNNVTELMKNGSTSVQKLAEYLKNTDDTTSLGMNLYNSLNDVKLNIARAEAKLSVKTSLQTEDSSTEVKKVKITDKDKVVNYDVDVASEDGGRANDFSYYIPIVSDKSKIDTDAMVAKNAFNLRLAEEIKITSIGSTTGNNAGEIPYKIYYTTDENLDSLEIRKETVNWSETIDDYSEVTAIKIATIDDKYIDQGEIYRFNVKLKYKGTSEGFNQLAGSQVQWKSFGHYTYTRGGTTTTNTYPSSDNEITIGYEKDLTENKMDITLGTSDSASNPASKSETLAQTFKNPQELKIKKVEVSNGTLLISNSPENLTGAQANNQFKVDFAINDKNVKTLLEGSSNDGTWNIDAEDAIKITAKVTFSKALTDSTTARYIDITFGNDNINIKYRIDLLREVEAAEATRSGVVGGEVYQVPKLNETKPRECSISQNSAFTGLYYIENFVPGNYKDQTITWKKGDEAQNLPKGATIIMMPVNTNNSVEGYWYYKADGTKDKIDLTEFTKMSGTGKYQYSTKGTTGVTLRYLFVVNFGDTISDLTTGSYKLVFGATGVSDANTFKDVELSVGVESKTTYSLSEENKNGLSNEVSYSVNPSLGNDSYQEGKIMSLVLTPSTNESLPEDAYIQVDDKKYTKTGDGQFIIPIGTISDGTKTLTLKSDMFPDEAKTYNIEGQLYLLNSNTPENLLNGKEVATKINLQFVKEKVTRPAIKISGTQVAELSEWINGQPMTLKVENLPTNGTLTVTAYSGITGTQKVSDLLSSVSGVFTFKDGVGTYDLSKNETNKLTLSSAAISGTYRLVFEMKDANGKNILEVPYYFIVQ